MKGTDVAANSPDAADAVLVYHHIAARDVLLLDGGFLALAGLLGIYVIARAGWLPLLFGLVGVAALVFYSAGPWPLSYLPVGELVSGFVMGGLLPLAVFVALTGRLAWQVLYFSLPLMLGVALVMLTNNCCDIERDRAAGRKTLPVLLDRLAASVLYRGLLLLWPTAVGVIVALHFGGGWFVLPLGLLGGLSKFVGLFQATFFAAERGRLMVWIVKLNIWLNGAYVLAVLLSLLRG